MSLPCQIAIRRLARITAALTASEMPAAADRAWFVARLGNYFADAGDGLDLETALDLSAAPGGVTWPEAERRGQRDALLHGMAAYHFPDLPVPEAARKILAAWHRYARRQAAVDLRRGESAAPERSLGADLFALARLGGPPGYRRVADVLSGAEPSEEAEVYEIV